VFSVFPHIMLPEEDGFTSSNPHPIVGRPPVASKWSWPDLPTKADNIGRFACRTVSVDYL
jgi:hypothetical protein